MGGKKLSSLKYAFSLLLKKKDPFLQLSCSLAPAKHNAMIGQQKHKKTYKRNISSKAKRSWVMVHKTETVMDNQHPSFRKFTLDINHLCHGNIDQAVLLEVYDWGTKYERGRKKKDCAKPFFFFR